MFDDCLFLSRVCAVRCCAGWYCSIGVVKRCGILLGALCLVVDFTLYCLDAAIICCRGYDATVIGWELLMIV